MPRINLLLAAIVFLIVHPLSAVHAADTPERTRTAVEQAFQAAQSAARQGPADIPFADQGTLHLPPDYEFIPAAPAKTLMEALGNRVGEGFIGLIFPTEETESGWFVAATYFKSGYVKDDDAKDWDADKLLKDIRSGTEETNAERKKRGIPEMDILGWVEKPTYDTATHRLVWSIATTRKGEQTDPSGQGINYNTLALGREGYISMNMVTDRGRIEALKPVAKSLLGDLEFNSGKRYADFKAGTDKVAAYGLAALVAGVAAKKLGLMAVIIAFVAKFAKIVGFALIAFFSGFFKFFKRRKTPPSPSLPKPTSPPPPSEE